MQVKHCSTLGCIRRTSRSFFPISNKKGEHLPSLSRIHFTYYC
jgi:hypothetical protein